MDPNSDVPRDVSDIADADLVLRTRSGDSDAFGELWRRHYRSGITVARSVTSTLDPDDLVQEAYTRIYQSIVKGGGPTGSFRAYLFTSIRNTAAGWGRARRETAIDEIEEFEDPQTSDQATDEALDRSLTHRAFRSLPTRWQEVLWYSEIEQMKPAEIAPLLGMKATAVAQLTFRAREGLREAWIQAHLNSVADGSPCQWTIERLGAYARNNLGRRDHGKVEAHLADCARCAIVASEAKDVSHRLALILLPLAIGGGAATAYLATVQGGAAPIVALAAGTTPMWPGAAVAGQDAAGAAAGSATGSGGSGTLVGAGAGTGSGGSGAAGGAGSASGAAGGGSGAAAGGSAGAGSVTTAGAGAGSGAAVGATAAGGGAAAGAGMAGAAVAGAAAGGVLTGVGAWVAVAAAGALVVGGAVTAAVLLPPATSSVAESTTADDTTPTDGDASAPGPGNLPVPGASVPVPPPANPPSAAPADPGTTTPGGTAPGAGPTDPGTTDPGPSGPGTNPGPTDPTDPGPTDPTDPGPTDPTDPGPTDPTDPGPTDPGPTDPTDPTDPVDPGPQLPDGAPSAGSATVQFIGIQLNLHVPLSGAPGSTVEVLLNGSSKGLVTLDSAGAGTVTLRPTLRELLADADVDVRYVLGDLAGPWSTSSLSDLIDLEAIIRRLL